MRLHLEPVLARLAAERRTDDDLAALRAIGRRRAVRAHGRGRARRQPRVPSRGREGDGERRAPPAHRLALDRRRRPAPPRAPPHAARLAGGRRRRARASCSPRSRRATATARRRSCASTSRAPGVTGRGSQASTRRERVRLVHVLSENWTLTTAARPPRARPHGAGGRGRRLRRRDAQRARRPRPGRRCRRPHAEPAGLRAPRQPGPGDAVAELPRPPLGDRLRDDHAAARCGGDHRAAPPSAAPREGSRDARSSLGGPARRPPHRQLARARVPRARCPVRRPRRAPRRASRRVAGGVGAFTRLLRRRPLPLRRRLGGAEAVAPRRRAALVRLEHAPRAPPAPHRPVRPRLEPARLAERRGRRPPPRGRSRTPAATSTGSSSSAARAAASPTPTPSPTSTRPSRRSRRRSSEASRRSASSRRSSSTTRRSTPRGAARSSGG